MALDRMIQQISSSWTPATSRSGTSRVVGRVDAVRGWPGSTMMKKSSKKSSKK
ncbi:hypothetical protein ND748_18550 [Frankia sp. AiPs1]|uniref:hypothetical protein n=1 Tax=Frankia sp. AiPs1 TaxID=573493 RepID=UPI00204343BE|nr:hypothetical protein [Frankia sp. AiPs1]MCM3923658.1 hypothetical protein [Frankia sp. AiPs1]